MKTKVPTITEQLITALEATTAWLEDLLYEPPCNVPEGDLDHLGDDLAKAKRILHLAKIYNG